MAVVGLCVHVLPDLLLGSEDTFNNSTCKNNVLLLSVKLYTNFTDSKVV